MYACEYLLKTRTISADIANRVEPLGVSKGKQDLYLRTRPETLEVLRETDISQSTVASNALEGVTVSPERLDALLARRDAPRDRAEEEITGYRDVLRGIDGLADPTREPITPEAILRLHKNLFRHTSLPNTGRWKTKDNVIEARNATGDVIGSSSVRPPRLLRRASWTSSADTWRVRGPSGLLLRRSSSLRVHWTSCASTRLMMATAESHDC